MTRFERVTLTAEQLAQMERLDAGVYADRDGGLHLIADELLEAHGFDPTPENVERLQAELRSVAAAYGVDHVEVRE